MKTKIILLSIIFCAFCANGKEKHEYVFENLPTIDTIYSQGVVDSLQKTAEIVESTFLIAYYETPEFERSMCLIRLEKDYWIVWEIEEPNVQSHYSIIGQSDNKQFLFVDIIGSNIARQTEYDFKELKVVDLKNSKFFSVPYYSSMHSRELSDNNMTTSEYQVSSSMICFTKKGFLVLTDYYNLSEVGGFDNNLIKDGEYELSELGLKRITFYDRKSKQFKALKYIDAETGVY